MGFKERVVEAMLDVCLLGTGGTMPLPKRALTALSLSCGGRSLLIDCGEGTQMQLRRAHRSLKAIELLLFTHLHADHIAGLPGLLLSIGKDGRREPLRLLGPEGLSVALEGLCSIVPDLPYSIECTEIAGDSMDIRLGEMLITAFMVQHSLPCFAYTVQIERRPSFIPERAEALGIPKSFWSKLQKGESIELDGKSIAPELVCGEARDGIKLCYATDTRPTNSLLEHAKNAGLFICEGMYLDETKLEKAVEHEHMMVREAAELAKAAQVRKLWLTHYSPSLDDPDAAQATARKIFPESYAGEDMRCEMLCFRGEKDK